MDKPKWYSKLINMAVVLSVLLSLLGVAILPVAAQDVNLGVTVDAEKVRYLDDVYCVCDNFTVTANITNTGTDDAQNVTANITWDLPSGANWVSGHNSSAPHTAWVGNVSAGGWEIVEWVLHCNGPSDPLTITVDAGELLWEPAGVYVGDSVTNSTNVTQLLLGSDLTVTILTPPEGSEFTYCTNFNLTFNVTNTGLITAYFVNARIDPSSKVNGVGYLGGQSFSTSTIAQLLPDETHQWIIPMHCDGCDELGYLSSIHVMPMGEGGCSETEIQSEFLHSDIVHFLQKYGVSCNVTPNPSKVCHNVTFTATIGECAVLPLFVTLDWGDGTDPQEFGVDHREFVWKHHYNISGNHTAVINVTDAEGINATCNVTVEVFPRLTAACNVTPFDFTKVCHNLTFNGTAVGGFPGDLCTYNWTWDFGDNITENGTGYGPNLVTHHYNASGNYTAVFIIEDDCMNNTANCTVNITVFEPLDISCNVSANVTKIGHNVTFCGEAIDGIPEGYKGCTYDWTWTFYKDGSYYCSLDDSGSGNPGCTSPEFTESGNYTGVFFTEDTCWGNNATCNVTVEVHPGLNMTCDAEDSTVCNAVNFTAILSGGVPNSTFNWTWDFGDPFDPTPGTTQNASHMYPCTGNYTATVTVCDDLDPINCANCTVNVTITIEPPELHWPGNGSTVTVGCNNTAYFEWEDIGCCNYTLQIWQKEPDGQKVWNINVGKDNFAFVELWENNVGWRWQVVAVDICGEWVVSDLWYFNTERDCMYADVSVTRPNGGETFTCNTTEMITWEVTEYGTVGGGFGIDQGDLTIDIYYATGGGSWTPIATGEENDGAYPWMVPEVNSNQCLVKVVATDAQGNVGIDVSDSVFTIECAQPTTCTTLYAGWNLYASPLIPDNPDIANVTASINSSLVSIQTYDATAGTFPWYIPGNPSSSLTTIEAGQGYWVFMNSTDTICIVGQPLPDPPALPPTYTVVPGWNLIGFKSTIPVHHSDYLFNLWSGGVPNYSVLWGYDGSVPEYVNLFPMEENGGMMEPGHGYWLWATAAGIIVPSS